MKKTVLSVLFALSAIGSLQADCDVAIEARASAFFPSSDRFAKIYGDCLGCYELEASAKFFERFETWGNFNWVSKKGKSDKLGNFTRLTIENSSFGIKYPYQISENFIVYVGIGPSFGRVRVHNRSPSYHDKTTEFVMGGALKTGVRYLIDCHVFLDLFFDYLYQPSRFKTHVELGGSKLGAGIGYKF